MATAMCLAFLSNYWLRNCLENAPFVYPLSLLVVCLGDSPFSPTVRAIELVLIMGRVVPCCCTASLKREPDNPEETDSSYHPWLGGTAGGGLLAPFCVGPLITKEPPDPFNPWAFDLLWSVKTYLMLWKLEGAPVHEAMSRQNSSLYSQF